MPVFDKELDCLPAIPFKSGVLAELLVDNLIGCLDDILFDSVSTERERTETAFYLANLCICSIAVRVASAQGVKFVVHFVNGRLNNLHFHNL